jgi:hypothetical protein
MNGREVSVLVNDKEEAGVHVVKFDADGLAGECISTGFKQGVLYRRKG